MYLHRIALALTLGSFMPLTSTSPAIVEGAAIEATAASPVAAPVPFECWACDSAFPWSGTWCELYTDPDMLSDCSDRWQPDLNMYLCDGGQYPTCAGEGCVESPGDDALSIGSITAARFLSGTKFVESESESVEPACGCPSLQRSYDVERMKAMTAATSTLRL